MIKLKQFKNNIAPYYEFSFYVKTDCNKDSRWVRYFRWGEKEKASVSDYHATELTIELEEVNEQ